MIAVEEVEITFRQIAGADIILILIPFNELFFDFGICPFFKLDDPVIKTPAIDTYIGIHDEHDQMLVIQPPESLCNILFF